VARSLEELHEAIEGRSRAIREARGSWPCAAGCSDCCRSLARPPELTAPEMARLRRGLARLPAEVRRTVHARIAALGHRDGARPIVCPMLDRERGRCLVYADRPTACRTYGFYVRRHQDLVCEKVERHAAEGPAVVWGNHEAVDVALERLAGRPRPLTEWWAEEP
jgi:Fe-S-cluster containining protein